MNDRVTELDLLRCVALLLVLLQHTGLLPFQNVGWTGVDLFFVLSGFLVTGLLLRESAAQGRVDGMRFLVRRGLKIYLAFWAMIGASLLWRVLSGYPLRAPGIVREVLFLQNYGPGLWMHTWSLAVEEHFYLLLVALFWLIDRRGGLHTLSTGSVMRVGLLALGGIFLSRLLTVALCDPRERMVQWGTHVRIDSLLFGGLLAFFQFRHPEQVRGRVRKKAGPLLLGSVLCLLAVFSQPRGSTFTLTVGYTLLYLGYGGLLLLVLHAVHLPRSSRGLRAAAAVGRRSYSIYLWHFLVAAVLLKGRHFPFLPHSFLVWPCLYLGTTVTAGVLLSLLIEEPLLRLRDRHFPRPGAHFFRRAGTTNRGRGGGALSK